MNLTSQKLTKFFLYSALALLGLYAGISYGLQLDSSESMVNPISSVQVLVDPTGNLNIEDIKKLNSKDEFKTISTIGDEANFGFSNSAYWLKLALSRSAGAPSIWILEIPFLGLEQINFYAPDRGVIETGSSRPIQSRPIFNRYYAFPMILKEGTQDFYIRVSSHSPISIPLQIWQEEQFSKSVQKDTMLQALYYGGIGVLCIFNLLLFVYLRDRNYLLYFFFAGFIGLGIFAGNGYGRLYFWINFPEWDGISQSVFLGLGAGSAWLFTRAFLNTKKFLPKIDQALLVIAILLYGSSLGLVVAYLCSFTPTIFLEAVPLLSIPGALLTIYAGIKVWRAGQQSAKFFLLAWGALCLGTIVAGLRMFDLLPSNGFTSYALQISSSFEMLLLSFALADRIQDERLLREKAQIEVLQTKEQLLESVKASEEKLEKTVLVRTNDLRGLLENEKRLREQYVRFGSMISHEFRNPLGIIETQLALLNRDEDTLKLKKRVATIGSATHRLAMLFDRWLQGDRLDSKIDSVRPCAIDLNHWLSDLVEKCRVYHSTHTLTLNLIGLKAVIMADEKMLQAVVLNLIDNACKYSPAESTVTIKMKHRPGMIGISVSDQGHGIHASNHLAIYDEYRQINPDQQSRGMGLGLSFVKKIIELHSGEIELISELNRGSEFIAWFPEGPVNFLDLNL